METNVSPVGGWVLIRPDNRKEQTDSGIIIPTSVTEYGHTVGTVVRARDTYCTRDKGVQVPMPVAQGDRVMYRDYLKDLETIKVDGAQCCFIYIEDIVLVLGEENA
ncbi:MAG: co-chaperone GroES [Chlamydiota bacterium]|nr:co-chaperone GroES [Chlamydiota bacterium]